MSILKIAELTMDTFQGILANDVPFVDFDIVLEIRTKLFILIISRNDWPQNLNYQVKILLVPYGMMQMKDTVISFPSSLLEGILG